MLSGNHGNEGIDRLDHLVSMTGDVTKCWEDEPTSVLTYRHTCVFRLVVSEAVMSGFCYWTGLEMLQSADIG